MELDAIAAVVIGGTLLTGGSGYVFGSVLGVLVLGVIQTIITFDGTLSSWWTKIVIGGAALRVHPPPAGRLRAQASLTWPGLPADRPAGSVTQADPPQGVLTEFAEMAVVHWDEVDGPPPTRGARWTRRGSGSATRPGRGASV